MVEEHNREGIDWSATTWEGSRREQIRHWSKMSLGEILQAQEEMAKLSAMLAGPNQPYPARPETGTSPHAVAETPPGYATRGARMHDLLLPGCTPEPLMNYLKALGILRLVSEQADAEARGCWRNDVFVLRSKLDRDVLTKCFLNDYKPTPIVAPWNAGSGFYKKWDTKTRRFKERDVVEALDAVAASSSNRFEPYREQLRSTKHSLSRFAQPIDLNAKLDEIENAAIREHWSASKRKEAIKKFSDSLLLLEVDGQTNSLGKAEKDEFLAHLRSDVLDDTSLGWLDAAIVLLTGQKKNRKEAPVLGSGGNIGNSDFAARFMQLLLKVIPLNDAAQAKPLSDDWLRAALWAEPVPGLLKFSIDQFDPGKAGNANMGQGLIADPFLNPWDYILMVEGALLLGGTVAKRLGASRQSAVFPFCSDSSSVGFASAGVDDTRGELWLPLWRRPCSIPELKVLLGEGRAEVGRRPARTGVDFARAAASLGVDRGINAFVRYEFQKRLGDNYLANSLGRIATGGIKDVDLLRQLDPWLDRFRTAVETSAKTRDKIPRRFTAALSRIDSAIFNFATCGRNTFFQGVIVALGQAERELGITPGKVGQSKMKSLPITGLTPDWITAANDNSPEFELALALASLHDRSLKIGPLRSNLEPFDWQKRYPAWAEKNRAVVWNSAHLSTNLAGILQRRLMDAMKNGCTNLPLAANNFVSLAAVSRFLTGELDERRIEELLWGVMLLPQKRGMFTRPADDANAPPLPRAYALLKLLFLPEPLRVDGLTVAIKPEPSIVSLLTAGHVGEACRLAMRRLRASGLSPLPHPRSGGIVRDGDWEELEHLGSDGPRLAAALLLPLGYADVDRLRKLIARETAAEPQTAH
jgi:CRISPR-associated protein Csx17